LNKSHEASPTPERSRTAQEVR